MAITLGELKNNNLLKIQEYTVVFELVLDRMINGMTFQNAVKEDHRNIDPVDFLKWIMRNPDNKERYHEAQALRGELTAEELIGIADGIDPLEDIERSKLRIKTRREMMGIWDRSRFGDIKQLEVTHTASVKDALIEARSRVALFTSSDPVEDALVLPASSGSNS